MKITKILENINNIDITHSSDDELFKYIDNFNTAAGALQLIQFLKSIPSQRNISDEFAINLFLNTQHGRLTVIGGLLEGGYYPPEHVMMKWVKKDPSVFEYLVRDKIPPHDVQLAAISKNGFLIKSLFLKGYIPHDDVILAAIKNKSNIGAYIKKHIPFPSKVVADALYERTKGKHDLRKYARDTHPIRSNFNDWTEDELKRLVQNIDPDSLELVFKQLKSPPSIEIQKIAAKRNGLIVKYLPKPINSQVINIALVNNPNAIQVIDNPTVEQQKSTVYKDIFALQHIKHPAPEIISYAINKHPSRFINYLHPDVITDDMQLMAIKNDTNNTNSYMLEYIPHPTANFLDMYAVKYGITGYFYIKKRNLLTTELSTKALTADRNFKNGVIYQQFTSAVLEIFANNNLLLNKWLRYGE